MTSAAVWQGSDCLLIARIRSIDGTYLQQSAVSSIAVTAWNQLGGRDNPPLAGPFAPAVASVVFNTLQQNPVLWPVDAVGYNFLYRLAGVAALPTWVSQGLGEPTDGETWVDVIFTLTDGTNFPAQWDLSTLPVP